MRDSVTFDDGDLLEIERAVSVLEETNAAAEQDSHEIEPELVYESVRETLARDGRAAGKRRTRRRR